MCLSMQISIYSTFFPHLSSYHQSAGLPTIYLSGSLSFYLSALQQAVLQRAAPVTRFNTRPHNTLRRPQSGHSVPQHKSGSCESCSRKRCACYHIQRLFSVAAATAVKPVAASARRRSSASRSRSSSRTLARPMPEIPQDCPKGHNHLASKGS